MFPVYEATHDKFTIRKKQARHVSPHLHNAVEIVYVTEGSLEIGMAQELYHMEEGDLAIIFSDVIHHYQVFDKGVNKAIYMLVPLRMCGAFRDEIQKKCPSNPVIKKKQVHVGVVGAIDALWRQRGNKELLIQAYIQVIMVHAIPRLHLVSKDKAGPHDLIYDTVSYIAGHFQEPLTLERVAKEMGVGKYALSRVFSGTFHSNFNQYVNEFRADCAASLLENTTQTITEICFTAGFESQRTFNRAFKQRYRMTPGTYRNMMKNERNENPCGTVIIRSAYSHEGPLSGSYRYAGNRHREYPP